MPHPSRQRRRGRARASRSANVSPASNLGSTSAPARGVFAGHHREFRLRRAMGRACEGEERADHVSPVTRPRPQRGSRDMSSLPLCPSFGHGCARVIGPPPPHATPAALPGMHTAARPPDVTPLRARCCSGRRSPGTDARSAASQPVRARPLGPNYGRRCDDSRATGAPVHPPADTPRATPSATPAPSPRPIETPRGPAPDAGRDGAPTPRRSAPKSAIRARPGSSWVHTGDMGYRLFRRHR